MEAFSLNLKPILRARGLAVFAIFHNFIYVLKECFREISVFFLFCVHWNEYIAFF
jgi:hypothetical protein